MMTNRLKLLSFVLAIAAILALAAVTAAPALAAPEQSGLAARLPAGSPTLQEFTASLPTAPDGKPAGIYVAGTLALPIVQQPAGQPAFVSAEPGKLTQFEMANQYGSTGLLAHNNLAGAEFSNLQLGQFAALVFADGRVEYYRIMSVEQYQALDPNNPYSDFRGVDGVRLSASDLFTHVYGSQAGRLILQTCVAANGNPSWGRLFVIAEPVTEQVREALSQAAGVVQMSSLGLSKSR
jgi:hypothetical protein